MKKQNWIKLIGYILLWVLIVFLLTILADGFLGFKVDAAAATSSLVYDAGFGVEGGLLSVVLYITGCILLILWGRKPTNVWVEA